MEWIVREWKKLLTKRVSSIIHQAAVPATTAAAAAAAAAGRPIAQLWQPLKTAVVLQVHTRTCDRPLQGHEHKGRRAKFREDDSQWRQLTVARQGIVPHVSALFLTATHICTIPDVVTAPQDAVSIIDTKALDQ